MAARRSIVGASESPRYLGNATTSGSASNRSTKSHSSRSVGAEREISCDTTVMLENAIESSPQTLFNREKSFILGDTASPSVETDLSKSPQSTEKDVVLLVVGRPISPRMAPGFLESPITS